MADAITWKVVTEADVARLAQCHATEDCKKELAQILKIDESHPTRAFLLDLHLYTYSTFARQQHFQAHHISVLLGILQRLMDADFSHDSTTTLASSHRHFQSLLLAHSVERSPKSVQIFSPSDVAAVAEFVAHSYYRHFHLHKCIFTPFDHTHIVQTHANEIQLPSQPRPLKEAFLHPEEEPISSSSSPDDPSSSSTHDTGDSESTTL